MQQYDRREERTGVQEHAPYARRNDTQCDFVMIYGTKDIQRRAREWKRHGYVIHLMTGVSWGEYQDYLYGKYDGRDHHDEGQVNAEGKEINHGKDVPYMVPSIAFADYLTAKLKVAVDAGVEAIHLEEPEFWAQAGYSEAFKREWLIYYREPWQDPQASAEGQYRASKLKQYLYTRMLDRLCSALKEYALVKYSRLLRFYVPTHSLINYSQWRIVSPESALIDLPGVDGYIAQIWTGTSREPNVYEGAVLERTFETAFLEYGVMQELVRGTGRKMWFLHDPIEDNPRHTWRDYRENYYRTVTASVLHPGVDTYEVAPWPDRIFGRSYPTESGDGREPMPAEYATNLLTVMHTLRDMRQSDTAWLSDTQDVGLLLSDTCMFQRIYPQGDPRHEESRGVTWSSFYGLALPLLKHGLAVRPLQLENIRRYPAYLEGQRVLVLSYEFMKPETPDIHNALAQWVRGGGVLVYVGDSSDSFHHIRHWWNQGQRVYADPAEHLFEALGLPLAEGLHSVGKGQVLCLRTHPADLTLSQKAASAFRAAVGSAMEAAGLRWQAGNCLMLRRGRYVVTAAMDESVTEDAATLNGSYINLYQANLDVVENPELQPGSVGLYLDLSRVQRGSADILAISARVERLKLTSRSLRFQAKGPEGITCTARIALPRPPRAITATLHGSQLPVESQWHGASATVLVRFASSPDGVTIQVQF